ncbi:hypothetical protein ACS0TY_023010 [Phlomoides rotata]
MGGNINEDQTLQVNQLTSRVLDRLYDMGFYHVARCGAMTEIANDTDQEIVDQYARGCVLLMIGSYMMPDSSRSHVSLLYLQAIENIAHAGTYSWDSAVLAYLYRELCNAVDSKKTSIGGAVSLLQVFNIFNKCIHYS